ncbi:MAG: hypothetical protein K8I60_15420 [Anaerolineae bacterium]|nr:hypothetical protein [Anaerolineae bacterium]
MRRLLPLTLMSILSLSLLFVWLTNRTSAQEQCLDIHGYSSTGILNIVTGEYSESEGLRTYSRVSPDGQYTLRGTYTETESGLSIHSNQTGQIVQNITGMTPPVSFEDGHWSPDNRRIAVLSAYRNAAPLRLFILDVPTGTLRTFLFDDASSGYLGDWSADSAYLNFQMGADLSDHISFFMAAEGGSPIPSPVESSEIEGQRWSPDGHRLAVIRQTDTQQQLLLIDPEQGIVSSVDMPVGVKSASIAYSPDGNYLVIYHYQSGYNEDSGAFILNGDGTSPQIIPGSLYAVPDWWAFWSGNENVWLTLQSPQSPPDFPLSDAWEFKDLVAYHLGDGRSEIIQANVIVPDYLTPVFGSNYGASATYFSPDQQHIFMTYVDQGKITVALADADGQNRHVIVDAADALPVYNGLVTYYPCTACQSVGVGLSNPTWINNLLLAKWQQGQDTHLTWVDAESLEQHEILDASGISNIGVLASNRYVAYEDANAHAIVFLNLQTGQSQSVVDTLTQIPPWYTVESPDQQWAILVVGDPINRQYLISLSDLSVSDIGPGAAFDAGPTWSRDGQHVAFLKSGPDHQSVEIISPETGQSQVFPIGPVYFMSPREFVSRAGYMTWITCP